MCRINPAGWRILLGREMRGNESNRAERREEEWVGGRGRGDRRKEKEREGGRKGWREGVVPAASFYYSKC